MRDTERMWRAGRFREAAESALEGGHFEAAVADAYYACFHACAALVFSQGILSRTARPTHEIVRSSIARLARDPSLRKIRLGKVKDFPRSYEKLYNLREEAHYGAAPIERQTAREVVKFMIHLMDFASRFMSRFEMGIADDQADRFKTR